MIHLSATAEAELKRRLNQQASQPATIRLGVEAGGCATWYYTLQPFPQLGSDDVKFEYGSLQIVTASRFISWLDGLTIDYSEDLMGGSFRFINPNVAQTCGCSSSFTLDPDDAVVEDCTQPSRDAGQSEVDMMKDKMVP